MTTNQHAAPWTFRRIMQMLAPAPRRRPPIDLMTGREAVARALYGQREGWDQSQMDDYDASPLLQGAWGAEADRRIAHAKSVDRHIAAFHGISDADWIHLPAIVKRDHTEAFYQAKGMAA